MAAPYYKMIKCLIQYYEDLVFIDDKKFHQLIIAIGEYVTPQDKEKLYIPDNKELASKLNIPYLKLNPVIKALYEKLLEYYLDHPIIINDCEQIIHIHIPFDEEDATIKKKHPDFYFKFSRYVEVKMPFLPRVGDKISLDFIDCNYGINRGYVHSVEHQIVGRKQVIYIDVHPTDNYYFQWKKMEAEYENNQQYLRCRQWEKNNEIVSKKAK